MLSYDPLPNEENSARNFIRGQHPSDRKMGVKCTLNCWRAGMWIRSWIQIYKMEIVRTNVIYNTNILLNIKYCKKKFFIHATTMWLAYWNRKLFRYKCSETPSQFNLNCKAKDSMTFRLLSLYVQRLTSKPQNSICFYYNFRIVLFFFFFYFGDPLKKICIWQSICLYPKGFKVLIRFKKVHFFLILFFIFACLVKCKYTLGNVFQISLKNVPSRDLYW